MLEAIREMIARRELLYMFVWREIRVKYKQSIMGIMWAVLMPSVIVCAGLILQLGFARLSGKPLMMSSLSAVAVKAPAWAFVVASIRFGTNSLLGNLNLVTRVYMPRLIFPVSAIAAQLVDFAIASAVVTLFLAILGVGVSVHLVWLPLLVVLLVLLTSSIAIMCSAGALFFRDVKYLIEVLLMFGIFFTPVFYDSTLLGNWRSLLLMNPFSPILEGLATVIVQHQEPSLVWTSYSTIATAIALVAALAIFRKLEPRFAESI